MGKGARRRSRASGAGGGGHGSKRPRRAEEEEQEEEEMEPLVGEEEEVAALEGEDYCFVCKDGGDLRVCDFRGCQKAYHPACVGKDSGFLNSDEEFICEWHTCFICKGRSRYYCFCCPWQAFCQNCVKQAEFVPVLRKTKGFCTNCLRMAIMIEKNVDVDSDGERVDFNDRATYEFLFKEYWEEIVKGKESMTLDKLEKAYAFLKEKLNCKQDLDLEKVHDEEHSSDDDFVGNSDDDDDNKPSSTTKFNGTSNTMKFFLREDRPMKNGYVGWGSKELMEFLSSIGKDTLNSLDQHGATEVVKVYIQQKGLLARDKKKLVICDDKLKILFRRSKVRYNRIYSLLGKHIAVNMTSEDETFANSDDNNETFVRKKARIGNYSSSTPKCTPEINKRCFAALVRHNIDLIYLKKSLVVDLLREPDTFGSKVIGCFVRIKIDLNDYSFYMHKKVHQHRKLYQLGLVTGTSKSPEEYKINDVSTDILLCISSIPDIKISSLSDEEYEEGDLEEKARSLRREIVNHWISKELQRLERLIDRASEKGWRKEYPCYTSSFNHFEYLDKKQLLRKPSEQQRLLEEVPQVIPETEDNKDTEFQVTGQDKPIQKSTVALQGTYVTRASFLKSHTGKKSKGTDGERDLSLESLSEEKPEVNKAHTDGGTAVIHNQNRSTTAAIAALPKYLHRHAATEANNAGDISSVQELDGEGVKASTDVDTTGTDVQHGSIEATKANAAGDAPGAFFQKQCAKAADVITIDDDDEDNSHRCYKEEQTAVVDLEADYAGDNHPVQLEANSRGHKHVKVKERIWYYIDPQGDEQGPFTMQHLSIWWSNGFFPGDFRVWRTGQTSNDAILLVDALQMTR
ncbi:zinc ion binding [Zea mays]|uniref:Zinc ion binding n=1 Tax=Zea mays TaxID=4577 RepID=A0A1D6FPY9_MAIZE|nr:zinc ion binding [Zea mays]